MVNIVLLIILIVWSIYVHFEGCGKARFLYLINCPELTVCQNGIRWLKTHNINRIRYIRITLVYLIVLSAKLIFIIYFSEGQALYERIILIVGSILIPVASFIFFHDRAYYREYNRLLNVPYDEYWYTEHRLPAQVINLNKKVRERIVFSGLLMLLLQYVALYLL